MNQKQIGIMLIIIGVIIAGFTFIAKIREDKQIETIITLQGGSCYLPDGTCLHEDRDYTLYIIGFVVSAAILVLGIYLIFFNRTEKMIEKQATELKKELSESKKIKEFDAFLSGFTDDEKKVVEAVHNQEGILQSTLRYKTGMSKTGLSLLLKSLEERGIITRTEEGKSNKVFLKKKF